MFKFSDGLQNRIEDLLDKKKDNQLTEEEREWETIGELDRIFTHVSAMVAAEYGS